MTGSAIRRDASNCSTGTAGRHHRIEIQQCETVANTGTGRVAGNERQIASNTVAKRCACGTLRGARRACVILGKSCRFTEVADIWRAQGTLHAIWQRATIAKITANTAALVGVIQAQLVSSDTPATNITGRAAGAGRRTRGAGGRIEEKGRIIAGGAGEHRSRIIERAGSTGGEGLTARYASICQGVQVITRGSVTAACRIDYHQIIRASSTDSCRSATRA